MIDFKIFDAGIYVPVIEMEVRQSCEICEFNEIIFIQR